MRLSVIEILIRSALVLAIIWTMCKVVELF